MLQRRNTRFFIAIIETRLVPDKESPPISADPTRVCRLLSAHLASPDRKPPPDRHEGHLNISLVVPVKNEAGSIGEIIASISRQTRPPDEVILVDGGSNDQTVALAEGLTGRTPGIGSCERVTRPRVGVVTWDSPKPGMTGLP